MGKLKIALINATGGGMSGGYRQYLRNVIPIMAAHKDVNSILCATPKSLNIRDWFDSPKNVRFIDCKPVRFLGPIHDQCLLQQIDAFSPDVIFVPLERSFHFKDVPVVNMFQNMEPFAPIGNESSFLERLRHRMQRIHGKRAVKGADRVIAISGFVSDFLATNWKIPKEKIGLVYHGIDVEKAEDGRRPNSIPDSWNNKFIFTAGSICPARGLVDLLLAMKHLSLQGDESVRLVIAGEPGRISAGHMKKLKALSEKNNLSDRICWTGSLNEKEMAWCYENSNAFVMTSRVESFGIIAGEAMAHGCICISADNPCLPEIFSDSAIYYPPKDAHSLAEAIKTVLSFDDNQRKTLSEKARQQAAKFSWDVCAEKVVKVLSKAARGNAN